MSRPRMSVPEYLSRYQAWSDDIRRCAGISSPELSLEGDYLVSVFTDFNAVERAEILRYVLADATDWLMNFGSVLPGGGDLEN